MKKYSRIYGTHDILPAEADRWREIETVIHDFMELHGYGEIRTPVFESSELFSRGIGSETDIVSKEMYTWQDTEKQSLTLKPELTAPVVRAFVEHHLGRQTPITRLYYMDTLFRRERPQKGRQRQFNQFGLEAFGSPHPEQDAEVISMAYKIFETFGIEQLNLQMNTIGSPEVRPEYLRILREALEPCLSDFCETCQTRMKKNALRLFDCKNSACQALLDAHAPLIPDYVTDDDRIHYDQVLEYLTQLDIPFTQNSKMVRGLDYYSRTTFEITSAAIGAQDALCGGGRYDGLVEQLGGRATPAVGFAAGMERLLLAMEQSEDDRSAGADVYFLTLGEKSKGQCLVLADRLRREKGLRVVVETMRRSMKAQMREANRQKAQYAVIIGDNEVERKVAIVKDMSQGDQHEIPFDSLTGQFLVDDECSCCDDDHSDGSHDCCCTNNDSDLKQEN